MTNDLLTLL